MEFGAHTRPSISTKTDAVEHLNITNYTSEMQ